MKNLNIEKVYPYMKEYIQKMYEKVDHDQIAIFLSDLSSLVCVKLCIDALGKDHVEIIIPKIRDYSHKAQGFTIIDNRHLVLEKICNENKWSYEIYDPKTDEDMDDIVNQVNETILKTDLYLAGKSDVINDVLLSIIANYVSAYRGFICNTLQYSSIVFSEVVDSVFPWKQFLDHHYHINNMIEPIHAYPLYWFTNSEVYLIAKYLGLLNSDTWHYLEVFYAASDADHQLHYKDPNIVTATKLMIANRKTMEGFYQFKDMMNFAWRYMNPNIQSIFTFYLGQCYACFDNE